MAEITPITADPVGLGKIQLVINEEEAVKAVAAVGTGNGAIIQAALDRESKVLRMRRSWSCILKTLQGE
ncbi:hypothetical protein L596_016896 [Steinernema carpocapsae]|uniref:Uncharacterized protein n=1 Tax=Steinernema carpocapsae TaxID=34508 RepID=A0A4V6A3K2_STECR|nr:hypothetical protein L596_016896 [Steinernema carpocapsae]